MGNYSFKLPDLGEGIVESEVVEWYVAIGDEVSEDQHIADVMTDKATVEVTTPVAGRVLSLACDAGEMVPVGSELILFDVAGGDSNTPTKSPETIVEPPREPAVEVKTEKLPEPEVASAAKSPPITRSSNHRVLASPSVRQRAREEHIDPAVVPGSGPAGRISNTDLENFIAAGGMQASMPSSDGVQRGVRTATTDIKIKGLRRIIANKMAASKRNIPHYSYVEEIDVSALEELRQHLNSNRAIDQAKLTLLPFIIQSLVKALPDFPHCNARYDDQVEVLTQYDAVHVGIATMTNSGLMVPVIKHCEAMDIWQTAAELVRLTEAARDGTIQSEELKNSSITITSLGAMGGIVTTPVINAPETAIIGVNKLLERPVVKEGEVVVRKMMNISSSFDHRIVDGYDGALLVQSLKRLLENPGSIFV